MVLAAVSAPLPALPHPLPGLSHHIPPSPVHLLNRTSLYSPGPRRPEQQRQPPARPPSRRVSPRPPRPPRPPAFADPPASPALALSRPSDPGVARRSHCGDAAVVHRKYTCARSRARLLLSCGYFAAPSCPSRPTLRTGRGAWRHGHARLVPGLHLRLARAEGGFWLRRRSLDTPVGRG